MKYTERDITKVSHIPNTPGLQKSARVKNSLRSFCIGVPVITIRFLVFTDCKNYSNKQITHGCTCKHRHRIACIYSNIVGQSCDTLLQLITRCHNSTEQNLCHKLNEVTRDIIKILIAWSKKDNLI